MKKSGAPIYQIKVTLRHVSPPVWRRIEVSGDVTLGTLHDILQTVMGWADSHLHAFRAGGVTYGIPDPEADFTDDTKDERNVRLEQIAAEGDTVIYEYDFADRIEARAAGQDGLFADSAMVGNTKSRSKSLCPP